MPGLPFGLSSGCTFEKCKVQTGDSGTVSLRVAGDVPPEKLKYEYQQSTTKDVDQKMWEHTNVETEGPTFTIDGLQPVATGGSLYVRVRWPTAAGGWSNWSQMASLRKWKGSASEDDAGDDVEDDAEPTRDAEPAPELTPPPEPGPTPVPDKVEHHNKLLAERKSAPAPQTKEKKVSLINDEEYTSQRAIDESLPTAGSERNTEPQTVQQQSLGSTSSSSASATANAVPQLTDEQKQAILDKVKAVKDDCRQAVKAGHQSDLTNAVDRDVGHDYTVSFKPKNEAAGQMRDSALSWKGHNHSGASEAELKRVLGLASESAGSKRKTEPQAVQQQSLGSTSSSVAATSAAAAPAAAMQVDSQDPPAYRSASSPMQPPAKKAKSSPAAPNAPPLAVASSSMPTPALQTPAAPAQHVALPKPRGPTRRSAGSDWIEMRIELEGKDSVLPTYEFEVRYKTEKGQISSPISNGLTQVFSVTGLICGEKYRFQVRIRQGEVEGVWSNWSSFITCKEGRDPIGSELKRKMWADFYTATDEHEDTGSRLDQPCLGCQARGAPRPVMLSPLLTNVDASHVIADALGGPSAGPDDAWNFVPLCAVCNRTHQGTKNMIDWLLQEGEKSRNLVPLYETLIRLKRACVKNGHVDDTGAAPPANPSPRLLC